MEILKHQFNGKEVDFLPLTNDNVLVNATQMGKVFDKHAKHFFENKQNHLFLFVLEMKYGNRKPNKNSTSFTISEDDFNQIMEFQGRNSDLDQSVNEKKQTDIFYKIENGIVAFTPSENILLVYHGGKKNGTWMHRLLAIDFAMWLNPYFKLWVLETIDKIIYRFFTEQRNAKIAEHKAKRGKKSTREDIINNHTDILKQNPVIASYFDYEDKETDAKKKYGKSKRAENKEIEKELDLIYDKFV